MLISAFWATSWQSFSNFFLDIEKFYQVLSTYQISYQLDHSNRSYIGGQNLPPPPPVIPICKKPSLFRAKGICICNLISFLHIGIPMLDIFGVGCSIHFLSQFSIEDDVNRKSWGSTKQKDKWCKTCAAMTCAIICMCHLFQVVFPSGFLDLWHCAKHPKQCPIKSFYLTNSGGMIRRCSGSDHTTRLLQDVEQFILKFFALIVVYASWKAITKYEIVEEFGSCSSGRLCIGGVCLSVYYSKMIHYNKDVLISSAALFLMEEVDGHDFKRSWRCAGLKRFLIMCNCSSIFQTSTHFSNKMCNVTIHMRPGAVL